MPGIAPNLHHLELFYHVVKSGGITAATRTMPYGIQQPAVSGQISQLEQTLGLRLFQRRPFRTTPAGDELYRFLAPFFDRLPEVVERIAGNASRHLRLAAPAQLIRDHLPAAISAIRQRRPDLELTLIEANQQRVFELIEREEVDLGFCELEGSKPVGLNSEVLIRLPLVLLLPKGCPKPKRGLRALAQEIPLIRTAMDSPVSRLFHAGLAKQKITWPSKIEVSDVEMVNAYVGGGFGAGATLKIPGARFPSGTVPMDLPGFPKLWIAGLWRGKLHPIGEEVLAELRKVALRSE